MEAITFKDVILKLKDKKIINQLSGHFKKGRITAIIGPSGSGKSTVLKLCNGLLTPTSGQIKVFNQDQAEYDMTDLRRQVGIALQEAPMIHGTVKENLLLPFEIHQEKAETSDLLKVLRDVDLPEAIINAKVDAISGGEKQRVALARLLLQDAKVLLLDEITSNLDESSMQIVEETLRRYQNEKQLTLVWVTHHIEQAKRMADDVWFMRDGYLEKSGSVNLLKNMSDDKLRQWMGEEHS